MRKSTSINRKSFLAIQTTRETWEEIRIQIYRTRVSAYEKTPLGDSFGHITLQKQKTGVLSKDFASASTERRLRNEESTNVSREMNLLGRRSLQFGEKPETLQWGRAQGAPSSHSQEILPTVGYQIWRQQIFSLPQQIVHHRPLNSYRNNESQTLTVRFTIGRSWIASMEETLPLLSTRLP
jgi:hypothetical protein